MNIYDISQKAGVSIATVSRVINNSDKVSDKTRKRVLQIMEETGYTPNVFARGLTNNSIHTIGLLCVDCSDHFIASAISYLEHGFRDNGYDCILCCTGPELANRQKYLKLILSKKVDAVVLVGSSFIQEGDGDENQYLLDAAKEVPLFSLNGFLDGDNIFCTLCDDEEAVYNATTKVLADGFKKPLFIYRSRSYTGFHKLKGFLKACKEQGFKTNSYSTLLMDESIEDGMQKLISHSKEYDFDCVIAGDDELAVSAHKYAKSKKMNIPKDFAIIGYNNSKVSICCDPELSTMDNQLEFVCNNTVSNVMDCFGGAKVPNKTIVSAKFIERGTTK